MLLGSRKTVPSQIQRSLGSRHRSHEFQNSFPVHFLVEVGECDAIFDGSAALVHDDSRSPPAASFGHTTYSSPLRFSPYSARVSQAAQSLYGRADQELRNSFEKYSGGNKDIDNFERAVWEGCEEVISCKDVDKSKYPPKSDQSVDHDHLHRPFAYTTHGGKIEVVGEGDVRPKTYGLPSTSYDGPLENVSRAEEMSSTPIRDHVSVYHSGTSTSRLRKLRIPKVRLGLKSKQEYNSSSSELSEDESKETAVAHPCTTSESSNAKLLLAKTKEYDAGDLKIPQNRRFVHSCHEGEVEVVEKVDRANYEESQRGGKKFGESGARLFSFWRSSGRKVKDGDEQHGTSVRNGSTYPAITSQVHNGPVDSTDKSPELESTLLRAKVSIYNSEQTGLPGTWTDYRVFDRAVHEGDVDFVEKSEVDPQSYGVSYEPYVGHFERTVLQRELVFVPLKEHSAKYHSGQSWNPTVQDAEVDNTEFREKFASVDKNKDGASGLFSSWSLSDRKSRSTPVDGHGYPLKATQAHTGHAYSIFRREDIQHEPFKIENIRKSAEGTVIGCDSGETTRKEKTSGLPPISCEEYLATLDKGRDLPSVPFHRLATVSSPGEGNMGNVDGFEKHVADGSKESADYHSLGQSPQRKLDSTEIDARDVPCAVDYPVITSHVYAGPLQSVSRSKDIPSEPLHTIVTVYSSDQPKQLGKHQRPQKPKLPKFGFGLKRMRREESSSGGSLSGDEVDAEGGGQQRSDDLATRPLNIRVVSEQVSRPRLRDRLRDYHLFMHARHGGDATGRASVTGSPVHGSERSKEQEKGKWNTGTEIHPKRPKLRQRLGDYRLFGRIRCDGAAEVIEKGDVNKESYRLQPVPYEGPLESIHREEELSSTPICDYSSVYHPGRSYIRAKKAISSSVTSSTESLSDEGIEESGKKEDKDVRGGLGLVRDRLKQEDMGSGPCLAAAGVPPKTKPKLRQRLGDYRLFGHFSHGGKTEIIDKKDVKPESYKLSPIPYDGVLLNDFPVKDLEFMPIRDCSAVYHSGLSYMTTKKVKLPKLDAILRRSWEESSSESASDEGTGRSEDDAKDSTQQAVPQRELVDSIAETKEVESQMWQCEAGPPSYKLSSVPYEGSLENMQKEEELLFAPIHEHSSVYHSGKSYVRTKHAAKPSAEGEESKVNKVEESSSESPSEEDSSFIMKKALLNARRPLNDAGKRKEGHGTMFSLWRASDGRTKGAKAISGPVSAGNYSTMPSGRCSGPVYDTEKTEEMKTKSWNVENDVVAAKRPKMRERLNNYRLFRHYTHEGERNDELSAVPLVDCASVYHPGTSYIKLKQKKTHRASTEEMGTAPLTIMPKVHRITKPKLRERLSNYRLFGRAVHEGDVDIIEKEDVKPETYGLSTSPFEGALDSISYVGDLSFAPISEHSSVYHPAGRSTSSSDASKEPARGQEHSDVHLYKRPSLKERLKDYRLFGRATTGGGTEVTEKSN
uniref:Uncharacterized protein n=1 Tax=Parascaris equorum TaxID=6256 RepID=A0A914RZW8_PAREQ